MKSDTNFFEIIGAITVGILVIVFMVWIGWIFLLLIFWVGVSSIYEPLTYHLENIVVWHCVILILIAILTIKLRKQS
jgi:hypothetical protein